MFEGSLSFLQTRSVDTNLRSKESCRARFWVSFSLLRSLYLSTILCIALVLSSERTWRGREVG